MDMEFKSLKMEINMKEITYLVNFKVKECIDGPMELSIEENSKVECVMEWEFGHLKSKMVMFMKVIIKMT